jgi:hydrogenase maturation protease
MICVIGIGSPYGDDQLGWKVIDELEQYLPQHLNTDLFRCETPVSDLLPILAQAEFAILIDAIHTNLPIGQICSWSQISLLPQTSISTHGMSLTTLLQLAENLGQAPAHWIVCGIVVNYDCVTLHDTLSPQVSQAIPKLLDYVQTLLETNQKVQTS